MSDIVLYPLGRIMHVLPIELLAPEQRQVLHRSHASRCANIASDEVLGLPDAQGAPLSPGGGSPFGSTVSGRPKEHEPCARVSIHASYEVMASAFDSGTCQSAPEEGLDAPQSPGLAVEQAYAPAERHKSDGDGDFVQPGRPMPPAYALIDTVPQDAYKQICLCRTMLQDHLLPNYARACNAIQDYLEGSFPESQEAHRSRDHKHHHDAP